MNCILMLYVPDAVALTFERILEYLLIWDSNGALGHSIELDAQWMY